MDACRVGSLRQQASGCSILCDCLRSLHWSLITDNSHAVTCHKDFRRGRSETRTKVKNCTCLPPAPQPLLTTNLQKLIIPTDETSRPIAKHTHKQLPSQPQPSCLSGVFLVILATSRQFLPPSLLRLSVALAAPPFSHYLHQLLSLLSRTVIKQTSDTTH